MPSLPLESDRNFPSDNMAGRNEGMAEVEDFEIRFQAMDETQPEMGAIQMNSTSHQEKGKRIFFWFSLLVVLFVSLYQLMKSMEIGNRENQRRAAAREARQEENHIIVPEDQERRISRAAV